jgi:hypothetical protein
MSNVTVQVVNVTVQVVEDAGVQVVEVLVPGPRGPRGLPGSGADGVQSDISLIPGATRVVNIVGISEEDYAALDDPGANYPDTAFLTPQGPQTQGGTAIHVGPDPPEDTSILWLDTQAIQ